MYPYEKQNLVPYRFLLVGSGLLFAVCVVLGIITDSAYGLIFIVVHVFLAFPLARNFFQWSPEPTAKRQYAVAFVVMIVIGLAGGFGVDAATDQYHLAR
ncbi:hypothetical protein [Brevundimonas sp.]|uniref:hypothetical protein n=1 Tax=Brevundimonas sp. TaxID=1871086 RepID=UPI0025C24649|nr:hypothetical protein [Brevundimonas sp.]